MAGKREQYQQGYNKKWGWQPKNLNTLGAIRQELTRVYRRMLAQDIAPDECVKASTVLRRAAEIIEIEQVEAKMAKLEATQRLIVGDMVDITPMTREAIPDEEREPGAPMLLLDDDSRH